MTPVPKRTRDRTETISDLAKVKRDVFVVAAGLAPARPRAVIDELHAYYFDGPASEHVYRCLNVLAYRGLLERHAGEDGPVYTVSPQGERALLERRVWEDAQLAEDDADAAAGGDGAPSDDGSGPFTDRVYPAVDELRDEGGVSFQYGVMEPFDESFTPLFHIVLEARRTDATGAETYRAIEGLREARRARLLVSPYLYGLVDDWHRHEL